MIETILPALYGASGLAAAAFYWPQIIKYIRNFEYCESISITTWGGWNVIAWIAVTYAVLIAKDNTMIFVMTLNAAHQTIVLAMGISYQLKKRVRAKAG